MQIRCVSSLTDEDEAALAPSIVALVASVFDLLPVTYVIQADTTNAQTCRCAHPPLPPGYVPIADGAGPAARATKA
jgi:hypothetical protein